MREQQLEGFKPAAEGERVAVIYKGPFQEITDDHGTVFPRGERVLLAAHRAERLRRGEGAGQFLVLG
jgi:hypothetical protein